MTTESELKAYRKELKENENTITTLTKKNKHIKDHIKYLENELKEKNIQESEEEKQETE